MSIAGLTRVPTRKYLGVGRFKIWLGDFLTLVSARGVPCT